MKILVTGSAGFIGSALSIKLLERGDKVVGIDNHNDYYDPSLKEARLNRYIDHPNYTHIRMDIRDKELVESLFKKNQFDSVVNLAAQAGVRYSIENPLAYIDSNIVGFAHILEGCRHNKVKHLVYASSSSVYGSNSKTPFSVHDNVDHPVSLYAASKKANELMAHSYSHLYNLPTTGLRFFTVYGPWDRPDMALQKFTKSILTAEKIQVYNYGKHRRDFTYIDDIVDGVEQVMHQVPSGANSHRVLNIGRGRPVPLMDFIGAIESALGKKATKVLADMQPGDVPRTFASTEKLHDLTGYSPSVSVEEGVKKFATWYTEEWLAYSQR